MIYKKESGSFALADVQFRRKISRFWFDVAQLMGANVKYLYVACACRQRLSTEYIAE